MRVTPGCYPEAAQPACSGTSSAGRSPPSGGGQQKAGSMQRQEQTIEESASIGAITAHSPSSPRTRRWGLPSRVGTAGTEGTRTRRIWLGGAGKSTADGHDTARAEVDPAEATS